MSSFQPRKGSLSCLSLKAQDGLDPVWGSGSPVCTEASSEGGVRWTLSSRILQGAEHLSHRSLLVASARRASSAGKINRVPAF